MKKTESAKFLERKDPQVKNSSQKQTTTAASRGVKEKEHETYNNKETKEKDQKDKKMQMKGKERKRNQRVDKQHNIILSSSNTIIYHTCFVQIQAWWSCREISTTTIIGNTTMSAVITSWELLTKWQTITFITNGSDKLPWLPTEFISSQQWCR